MNTQHGVRALIALAALYSAGCATLTTNIDPSAREAGVRSGSQVILKGNADGIRVFQGDSPMKIVTVENPDWKTAVGNSVRQEGAQVTANNSPGGSASYTKKMRYSPAIYLSQKQTHTLRLVRSDGAEAVVVRTPHVAKSYVIADWLLFAPTFGTSILIDWTTGKWKHFDAIDVNSAFASNATTKSGGAK